MANETIRIEGLDKIVAKLKKLEDIKRLAPAVKAATIHLKGKVDRYPPSTIANSPSNPSRKWYERGYGPRWARKDGSIGGSKTSQTLGRKWTARTDNGGLTGIVGNNVTYGPYVQDAAQQASFHKARGWRTIQDVVQAETETVVKLFADEVHKILNE